MACGGVAPGGGVKGQALGSRIRRRPARERPVAGPHGELIRRRRAETERRTRQPLGMKKLVAGFVGDREMGGIELIATPAAAPGSLRFGHDVFGPEADAKEREFVAEAPAVRRAKMAGEVPPLALVSGVRGVIAGKAEYVWRCGNGKQRGFPARCRRRLARGAGQNDGCEHRRGGTSHSVRTASAVWMRAATCAG